MNYLYRTSDHWPIYSPWTGRLLTFDSADGAAAYIIGPMQLSRNKAHAAVGGVAFRRTWRLDGG
jgi:hypothetical protein